MYLRRPWWEGSEGRHWGGPKLTGTATVEHWERDRGSREVSHRSLLQETVIEVEEGLLGFFGAQRAQHVCMQAAELGIHRAGLFLPTPTTTLPPWIA